VAVALQRAAAPFADGVAMVGSVASSGSRSKRGDLLVTLHEPGLTDRRFAAKEVALPPEEGSDGGGNGGEEGGGGVESAKDDGVGAAPLKNNKAKAAAAAAVKARAAAAAAGEDRGPFALRIVVEVKAGAFSMAGPKSLPAQVARFEERDG
jgi:hypothetical protein